MAALKLFSLTMRENAAASTVFTSCESRPLYNPHGQGLTFAHFSAQRKRFVWDRGCIQGLFRGCVGGAREYYGVLGSIRGCSGCICFRNGSG